MLYISNVFDRVNYCKLFNELLKRTISSIVLRLLLKRCELNGDMLYQFFLLLEKE